MKFLLMLIILSIVAPDVSFAQEKNGTPQSLRKWNELNNGDTLLLYIGRKNTFLLKEGETVELPPKSNGITINILDDKLIMLPKYPGVFPTVFKTSESKKTLVLVSRYIPLKQLKKQN